MRLTHLTRDGEAYLADIGYRDSSERIARAEGYISMPTDLIEHLTTLKKGNAYDVARLAGIMAAKKTADLIPLCHTLRLDAVSLDLTPQLGQGRIHVTAEVRGRNQVGMGLGALTAVNVALLTLYDMGKAVARNMEICGMKIVRY